MFTTAGVKNNSSNYTNKPD